MESEAVQKGEIQSMWGWMGREQCKQVGVVWQVVAINIALLEKV